MVIELTVKARKAKLRCQSFTRNRRGYSSLNQQTHQHDWLTAQERHHRVYCVAKGPIISGDALIL